MDTFRIRKKYQSILMFIIVIILFLPVTAMSAQIKSVKVIKEGTPVVHENQIASMWNQNAIQHGGELGPLYRVNPYSVQRPVMVRVAYSCDNTPKRISTIDLETVQKKDKWGEWVTDDSRFSEIVRHNCGEKTDYEKRQQKEEEKDRLIERANASYDKGDFKTAIVYYTKAIELNPNYSSLYGVRGNSYRELGKYNEAIVDYNKAITLNPQYDAAYSNRGFAYGELGKYNEAIVDYNKAIELNPKNDIAYYNRGFVYVELGKYNEAIVDLTKAIELNSNYANPYYHRARSYSMMGNIKSAIQDLTKAIQLKPAYKNDAKTEKDFDNIRNNSDFKKLIGE